MRSVAGPLAEGEAARHHLDRERHPAGRVLAERHQVPLVVDAGDGAVRLHGHQAVARQVGRVGRTAAPCGRSGCRRSRPGPGAAAAAIAARAFGVGLQQEHAGGLRPDHDRGRPPACATPSAVRRRWRSKAATAVARSHFWPCATLPCTSTAARPGAGGSGSRRRHSPPQPRAARTRPPPPSPPAQHRQRGQQHRHQRQARRADPGGGLDHHVADAAGHGPDAAPGVPREAGADVLPRQVAQQPGPGQHRTRGHPGRASRAARRARR